MLSVWAETDTMMRFTRIVGEDRESARGQAEVCAGASAPKESVPAGSEGSRWRAGVNTRGREENRQHSRTPAVSHPLTTGR